MFHQETGLDDADDEDDGDGESLRLSFLLFCPFFHLFQMVDGQPLVPSQGFLRGGIILQKGLEPIFSQ